MKKSLLFLVGATLTSLSASAQIEAPAVTCLDWEATIENAQTAYLYNVEAQLFVAGGNDWGTRACCLRSGGGNTSFTDFCQGAAEFAGYLWEPYPYDAETIILNGQETTTYVFANRTGSNNLVADNVDGIWVDGGIDRAYNRWVIEPVSATSFKLGYAASEVVDGETTWSLMGSVDGQPGYLGYTRLAEGNTNTFIEPGPNNIWALVSEAEYQRVKPLFEQYYAYMGLKGVVDEAKIQLPDADLSSYEALLSNSGTTKQAFNDAVRRLNPIVSLLKAIQDLKALDASRDLAKFVAISESEETSADELSAAGTLVNAFAALKQAINEGKELDAAHDYSAFEAIYLDDNATLDDVNAATKLVKAFVTLKNNLDKAAADYPTCDFSAPTAVYADAASDADQIAEAEKAINSIIADYNQSLATFDNPADITSTIDYITDLNEISAGNGTQPKNGWTREFVNGESNNFHINTWSSEGNPGNDGSNMTTPFIESWIGKPGPLADQSFFRNPVAAKAGVYKITANIRIYNESGASHMTGAYLFANLNRNKLMEEDGTAIEGAQYLNFNGMLGYWKDGFETYTIVPEGGTLKFGVQIANANYNWVAAKDFHVYYLGAGQDAIDYARANSELTVQPLAEDALCQKSLLYSFNAAFDAYNNATDPAEIIAAYGDIMSGKEAVDASVKAYTAFNDKFTQVSDYFSEHTDLMGDDVDNILDYIMEYGPAHTILMEREYTTEQVETELDTFTKMFELAIKNGMADGSDCTNMLVNADLSQGDKNNVIGWTGTVTDAVSTGPVAIIERYKSPIDFYQVVEGVPNGLYAISVQAYERPNDNGQYNGEEESQSFIFMNDCYTPIMNICKDAMPADKAVDLENCYITDAPYPFDYMVDGYGWVPNSVQGAPYAFIGDSENFPGTKRYTNTTYGLVTDGTMKIGITSKGKNVHWSLWANFRLTYKGKNVEALTEVIDSYQAMANTLMENDFGNPERNALETAYNNADDAIDSNDGETMYEALTDLINAYNEAVVSVEAYNEYVAAFEALVSEAETAENASESAIAIAQSVIDTESAAANDFELSTEEVRAFMERVKFAAAGLRVPNYDEASDDNAIDFTSCIVNPSFDAGNTDGWTYAFAAVTNIGYQGGQQYTGDVLDEVSGEYATCDKFIEGWRDGNRAIGDGSIEQTILALPAGTYTLVADVIANNQGGTKENSKGFYIFAKEEGGKKSSTATATANGKPERYYLTFTKESAESKITLGVEAIEAEANWLAADNFKLFYYGTESGKPAEDDPSDIKGVGAFQTGVKMNAAGVVVDDSYQGIILYNGSKYFNK